MAVDYEVGNILINLQTQANEVDRSLSSVITNLKALKRSVAGISNLNLDKVQSNLKTISTLDFSSLNKAFRPLENVDTKALSSFNRQMKNIANLNFDNVDFKKMHNQIGTLTRIIDPFIQKIVQAEPSLKAFSNAIDLGRVNAQLMVAEARVNAINSKAQSKKVLDDIKIEKANLGLQKTKERLESVNKKGKETHNIMSKAFNLGKIYLFINYAKRWGRTLGNVISSAINFEETLNKFQVSMGSNYERSLKFVNNITKAFNLSTESIMNYQSTFKNMLSALGNLSDDVSYELSETLTRMALDYASLFNVSTQRAMEQFQAVLSGQIRSIRSVSGYDVSEASIYNIYKSLGGTKSMRQLDQIEKRLLRIIALQEQMEATGAVNDFENTITSTANQLKQLTETLKEMGRWIGQLTMKFIAPLVEKILAGTIALREMLKSLNVAMGYFYKDYRDEEKGNGLFGESNENAEELLETIEEINGVLLGFDKLNILGSGSTNSKNADYQYLIDKIKEYSNSLTEVENQANNIASKILEWAGFTYNAEEGIWKFNDTLETTIDKVGYIFDKINEAFLMLVDKIIKELPNIIKFLVESFLGATNSLFELIPNLISTLMSDLIVAINENLPDLIKYINVFTSDFSNGLLDTVLTSIMNIVDYIPEIIIRSLVDMPAVIISVFDGILTDVLPDLLAVIVKTVLRIVEFVATLFPKVFNAIIGGITGQNSIFTGDFWKEIGGHFVEGWGMEGFAGQVSEQFKSSFSNILESYKSMFDFFTPIFEPMINGFKNAWESIKNWFGETLIPALGNFFINMINGVIGGFEKMINFFIKGINTITGALSNAWDWIGIPAIPQIKDVSLNKVPALANGGVIDSPTMALVGEYAGAKTNKEIVTPENLMREVFIESMLPIAQAIISGDREVVNAINDLADRPIELNGRKISENIYNDLQKVALRKGQTMFASSR